MGRSVKESIMFYIGADYLIVNSLLWGNKTNLDRAIEAVRRNNAGVGREAVETTPEVRWGVTEEEGEKLLEAVEPLDVDLIVENAKSKLL